MKLNINGKDQEYAGEEDRPLLWYLREDLKMTGTKFGCGVAACGACTVLVDGQPTRACVTPAASLAGKKITTIEGLGTEENLHPVQEGFWEEHGLQCGYCTPGFVMSLFCGYYAREFESGNVWRITSRRRIRTTNLQQVGPLPARRLAV